MANKPLAQLPYQPTLKLSDFEGPLDLLLHLIRQAKMNIYDIQIVQITNQYMHYLQENQQHRLEIAGEYFVMAATLMDIKSKMLLPQPPVEEDNDADEEDPRDELVEQLLEYERYKKAAQNLKDKEQERQQEYTREAMVAPKGLVHEQVAPGVSLDQLQQAFAKILKRHNVEQPEIENVKPEKITVAQRIAKVIRQVKAPTRFIDLFQDDRTRDNLITTFMAVLELTRHEALTISQGQMFGPLIVTPGVKNKEYLNEQSSQN